MLPYSCPEIDEKDIKSVVSVLESGWLSSGPKVAEFEKAFCDFTKASHAIAYSSGTSALHAAMKAIGIKAGDEVLVPAMTFVATANCVAYEGGIPVFCDVDADTLQIDLEDVARKITPATKAIIPVDYAGQPCDYETLHKFCKAHNIKLIADSCHAVGAVYKGTEIGTLADITLFSFHPTKPITTSEGGMVATENPEYAKIMRQFRNHGLSPDEERRNAAWVNDMTFEGYNYRMSELHAALGITQLEKLPSWMKKRQSIGDRYDRVFEGTDIKPLKNLPDCSHARHLYVVQVGETGDNTVRERKFKAMREMGIGVNIHYKPVHYNAFYRERFNTKKGLCPVAEAIAENILTIPLFPAMTDEQVDMVIDAVFNT